MMNNIYILYGLPASGKQSIAELLSINVEIDLYYHHIAFDATLKKYTKHSIEFRKHYKSLYFNELEKRLSSGSVITTLNYHSKKKNKLKDIRDFAIKNNANIIFLKIETNLENMLKRVVLEKRKANHKMTTVLELEKYLVNVVPKSISIVDNEKHYSFITDNISEVEVVDLILKEVFYN